MANEDVHTHRYQAAEHRNSFNDQIHRLDAELKHLYKEKNNIREFLGEMLAKNNQLTEENAAIELAFNSFKNATQIENKQLLLKVDMLTTELESSKQKFLNKIQTQREGIVSLKTDLQDIKSDLTNFQTSFNFNQFKQPFLKNLNQLKESNQKFTNQTNDELQRSIEQLKMIDADRLARELRDEELKKRTILNQQHEDQVLFNNFNEFISNFDNFINNQSQQSISENEFNQMAALITGLKEKLQTTQKPAELEPTPYVQIEAVEKIHDIYEETIGKLAKDLRTVELELKSNQTKQGQLIDEVSTLKTSNKQKSEWNTVLSRRNEKLESQVSELEEANNALRQENENLKSGNS